MTHIMRTRQTMTISLPPAMIRVVERVRKEESRTRSELIREALRQYFVDRYPVVDATPTELAAIRRGRSQVQRGQYVTLKRLLDDLDAANRKTRRKRA